MAVRGSGARRDPESMLEAAMADTLQEIAQQGSGVAPEDVVRAPGRQRQERPQRRDERQDRGQSRAAERPRDPDTGQFVPTRSERRQSSQDDESVDAYEVLGEPRDDTDQDDERVRRRTSSRRRASAPPVYNDEYEDDLDDDEEDDDVVADDRRGQRRRRDADEDEEDDESLDPEGGYDLEDADEEEDDDEPRAGRRGRADDDEEDEDDDRSRKRGSRRKRFSKRIEREIAQAVERRVGQVLAQNESMAAEKAKRDKIDAEIGDFVVRAIGTPQRRAELEAIVLNRQLPVAQRDRAAAELERYRSNNTYLEKYKAAADAVQRAETTANMQAAVKAMGELKALDPKVVATGDAAKITIHAYATGRALGQQEAAAEIRRLRKLLANRGGQRDERRPRRISGDRGSGRLPSASSRRANGRIGRADPLAGAMEKTGGVGRGTKFAAPTDEILRRLRDGEVTFRELGMGDVRVG